MSLPDEFWCRPRLDQIRTVARARLASPDAVLGTVLARLICRVTPRLVLPPLIGGHASLNGFYGLVAPSGGGKNAAMAAAVDALPFAAADPVQVEPLGSGERLPGMFMAREGRGRNAPVVQHTRSVLLEVGEVDTYAALANRRGTTLSAELRKLWNGERLGFGYADPDKRLPVEAHTYRACLVAGIQPSRAAALFDEAGGGTPQRFVLLSALDPDAPDDVPDMPMADMWGPPSAYDVDNGVQPHGLVPVGLDADITREIRAERQAQLRGTSQLDDLSKHRMLARLKVAAALALLDVRVRVTSHDWHLADLVMAESDRIRAGILAELAQTQVRRAESAGQMDAVRADAAEESRMRDVQRVILRHVEQHAAGSRTHGCTVRCFMRMVGPTKRPLVHAALSVLAEQGHLHAGKSDRDAPAWGLP